MACGLRFGHARSQSGGGRAHLASVLVDVNSRRYNNEYSRSMAAWALGRIGAAAQPEMPFLIKTMRSTPLLAVHRSTAEALGNFGAAAKPAVSELLKMLNNEDEITCADAAVALWKIDRHPRAVPALLRMLRQGNKSQAYSAAVALGQLESEAEVVAPVLIEALHAPDGDVRRAAAPRWVNWAKPPFRRSRRPTPCRTRMPKPVTWSLRH